MLLIIEVIPYRSFKQKISIVKSYEGKAKVEVKKDYIYVERLIKGA